MNSRFWRETKAEIGDYLKVELDSLVASQQYYPYSKDVKFGDYTYDVFGDFRNNRLFLTCKKDETVAYGRINSGVLYPTMIDRIFMIDRDDSTMLSWLSDMIILTSFEGKTLGEVLSSWDAEFEKQKNK